MKCINDTKDNGIFYKNRRIFKLKFGIFIKRYPLTLSVYKENIFKLSRESIKFNGVYIEHGRYSQGD